MPIRRRTTNISITTAKKSLKQPSQAEIDQFFKVECTYSCSPSAIRANQLKKINKYQETLRGPSNDMNMAKTTTSMFDEAALGRSNIM